jgi:hypothetical protein
LFDVMYLVVGGYEVAGGAALFMTGAGLLYMAGYLVVAHLLFVEKEL